ncbi:MAG: hypothetical protein JWO82_505 [Akkermansiaceae bacterium]|nr:hypothetical protein [Akkermansiaceae bacterium]
MRNLRLISVALLGLSGLAQGADQGFRQLGDFVIQSRIKLTGEKVLPTPIKPLRLTVSTDGTFVKIVTDGNQETAATFKIYRADGIGRQAGPGAALEVIPGVQATADQGGVHQHLRMTRENLILTTFPGVSDQTIITTAVAVPVPATVRNP